MSAAIANPMRMPLGKLAPPEGEMLAEPCTVVLIWDAGFIWRLGQVHYSLNGETTGVLKNGGCVELCTGRENNSLGLAVKYRGAASAAYKVLWTVPYFFSVPSGGYVELHVQPKLDPLFLIDFMSEPNWRYTLMADFKYEITERIAVLGTNPKGWEKQLNMISWNDREPKYDIRDWSPDGSKMGKGVSMTAEELVMLKGVLEDLEL